MRAAVVCLTFVLLSAFAALGAGNAAAQALDARSASDIRIPMSEPWTRVSSPNFIVQGDTGEKRLRDVAQRLEQFRDMMAGQLPLAVQAVPGPITVAAFVHLRDYQRFNRTAFAALGPERGGPAGALMVISVESKPSSDAADWNLYYEYTRLAVSKVAFKLPFWLEAGLTDYFATFRVSADGKTARVGLPIDEYRRANLRSGRPMPLAELVAMDRASTLTAENKMTGRFSAQSWALVHYLQLGSPARAGQARAFMQRLGAGEEGVAAFNASFPDAGQLEQEVLDYVNKAAFSYQELSFKQPLAGGLTYAVSRLSDAEVEAVRSALGPTPGAK